MTDPFRWTGVVARAASTAVLAALLLLGSGCGSEGGEGDVPGRTAPTYEQTVALFPVSTPGGRMGYVDNTGRLVLAALYADAAPFSEGLAGVRPEPDGLWGYIDVTGRTVIETQFAEVSEFCEGLAAVRLDVNGAWGYADTSGVLVMQPQFSAAFGFSEGLGRVRVDQDSGYVNTSGEWVIKMIEREAVGEFSGGLALVFDRAADRYGYIDQEGNMVIDPVYADAWGFSEDSAAVLLPESDRYGYVDRHGEWIVQPQFVDARPFSEGVAAVRWTDTGAWGYVDATGAEFIAAKWDLAEPFDEGLARVGLVVGDNDDDGSLAWGYAYIGLDGQVVWRDQAYAAFLAGTLTTVPVTDPPRPQQ